MIMRRLAILLKHCVSDRTKASNHGFADSRFTNLSPLSDSPTWLIFVTKIDTQAYEDSLSNYSQDEDSLGLFSGPILTPLITRHPNLTKVLFVHRW